MTAVNDFNHSIIEEFRANDGRVGGNFDGAPMLLLTTEGAKTGRLHTTPVVYLADSDGSERRIYVFASKAGAPTNPAWYHNLRANPIVTVELPGETFEARAVVAEGDERERVWAEQKSRMPGFADYEQKTSRTIPVVALERVA
jgi:deazaflavin-dependent oxidoreductase (nitroreductase family)